jgi:adenylate cyclase
VLNGLAVVRAQELETEVVALAVWDGRKGDGSGGTADAVARWKRLGIRTEIIDIRELRRSAGGARVARGAAKPRPAKRAVVKSLPSRVMAMIFADAVHFSKLREPEVPRFVEHFLGKTANLLARYPGTAVVKNTWGDGLYIVFSNLRDAGVFALDLAKMASGTAWSELGLPPGLNARIAVHAGPVFRCKDPVLNRVSYTGTHVSRAARIEPITPPGEVYASQAFAALASLEKIAEFRCEFVKQLELAKGYGSAPMYVVRRGQRS